MTASPSPESAPKIHRRTLAGYAFTVFRSSALLLVLEIVAGRLTAPYVHAIDELTYAHFGDRYDSGLSYLCAGGGAYSQPRGVRALSPGSRIAVAELDPAVTLAAVKHLSLDPPDMRRWNA